MEITVGEANPNLKIVQGVLYSLNDFRLIYYSMKNEPGEYKVKKGTRIIGADAFCECENITKLVIPKKAEDEGTVGLTAIGRRAFYHCENLKAINLEDTDISTVGADAFAGCLKLKKLTFPENVTSIAERAFQDCSNLTELDLPETITSIGDMAFRNCSSLISVRLPDGVTTIGKNTFAACKELAELVLPDSLSYIGGGAFQGCEGLKKIELPDSVDHDPGQLQLYRRLRLLPLPVPEEPDAPVLTLHDQSLHLLGLHRADGRRPAGGTGRDRRACLLLLHRAERDRDPGSGGDHR